MKTRTVFIVYMFKNSLNNDWKVIIIYIYVRKKLKLYYTIFHNVYSIFRKMPKMLSKAEKLSERKGFRIRRKMLLELSRQRFKLKCSLFNFFFFSVSHRLHCVCFWNNSRICQTAINHFVQIIYNDMYKAVLLYTQSKML